MKMYRIKCVGDWFFGRYLNNRGSLSEDVNDAFVTEAKNIVQALCSYWNELNGCKTYVIDEFEVDKNKDNQNPPKYIIRYHNENSDYHNRVVNIEGCLFADVEPRLYNKEEANDICETWNSNQHIPYAYYTAEEYRGQS